MSEEILVSSTKFIANIVIILLMGIGIALYAKKSKIPEIVFLLLVGLGLGAIKISGNSFFNLPPIFIASVSIIAVTFIAFEYSLKIKAREFDTLTHRVLKSTLIYYVLNMVFLTIAVRLLLNFEFWNALIFSSLIAGIDSDIVYKGSKKIRSMIKEIIKLESILITPISLIVPIIIIELASKNLVVGQLFVSISPIIKTLFFSFAVGIFIGLLSARVLANKLFSNIKLYGLLIIALITYILAQLVGGNGIIAVIIYGLFFANVNISKKNFSCEFSLALRSSLEMLVFLLIGIIVVLPISLVFILKSIALFIIYIGLRYIAIELIYAKHGIKFRDRLYITLNCQKGIAVAAFALFISSFYGLTDLLPLTLLFMIYSLGLFIYVQNRAKQQILLFNN